MKKFSLIVLMILIVASLNYLKADSPALYQHLPAFPGDPGSFNGTAVPLDSSTVLYLLAGAVISLRAFLPMKSKKKK